MSFAAKNKSTLLINNPFGKFCGSTKNVCAMGFNQFVFSVSRTVEDKQKNGGRIYIAKNRNGPDGMVYSIFMDTANVDIKVIGAYEGEAGQSPTLSKEEMAKVMLDKYKKLMTGAN